MPVVNTAAPVKFDYPLGEPLSTKAWQAQGRHDVEIRAETAHKGSAAYLCPDAEATHVPAGSKSEEVEAVYARRLNTGKVAEGPVDALLSGEAQKPKGSFTTVGVPLYHDTGMDGMWKSVQERDGAINLLCYNLGVCATR